MTEHHESDINPLWRSKQSRPFEKKFEETAIFSGSSNCPLAESIADCLGTKLGRVRLKRFADGEVSLQFLDSLRGKDVYIVQATSPPAVNDHLMELLLMISTSRRSSAKKITAVIPYYGYARQDRKLSSRVPISAADVARMIEAMGVDRVISVDLHSGQIQGFFGPRVPVDNLEAQLIGLEYFTQKKLDRPVVVSPDAGGVYRARKFQEGLRARGETDAGIAMLIKQRARANEIERMDVVGNVEGCDVIIVDDMIDTAGTLCEAAHQLRKCGAKRVFAFATHGLFSGPALQRIEESVLEEVVVSDSVPLPAEARKSNRITQMSIAPLIADAIRRIHQKESLEQLFIAKSE
ncbi:ribose-phosphate pyrophosphokinase-like [Condylostylus longicornis]|uniref:ribose-phosphate pyrophosphokinase-like n=1 Tax=Condylostylus longicornis TaxID=2530218 RepID=UPI00244E1545|nr:ribose-phosphate pyrophosphokinase-like [Condylostylus longicornis]